MFKSPVTSQDAQKDLSKLNASAIEKDLRTKINIVCSGLFVCFVFLSVLTFQDKLNLFNYN